MVVVNCAAIPDELVESELFGHVRGSFTGAHSARAGAFETAHKGTLFLDEVGDLPLAAQVALLRALQHGEIKRVGSDETRCVDVRVISATNVDLEAKIAAGEFRQDLFFRLNVIPIRVPALRDRGADLLLLAEHFLRGLARRMGRPERPLSPDALRALGEYGWPGNVRELEHAMERAFVLARGDTIEPADLPFVRPPSVRSGVMEVAGRAVFPQGLLSLPYAEAKRRVLEHFDGAYVRGCMTRADGNVSEAARLAGLDRANFRRIVRRIRAS